MTSVTQPSSPTIADVFGLFGQAFLERYPQPPHHHKLIRWIQICRTAKLGGHLQKCDDCDDSRPAYNSCRCRLCPQCQTAPLIQVESENFLFPVHALSQVFKAKFIARLRRARAQLAWPRLLSHLEREDLFEDFMDSLWNKDWAVYAKKPFRGPQQAIEYLGRYTHKTAISNRRIVKIEGEHVFFKYRDRKDGDTEKILELPAIEFLRRFMLHALPKGFQRIRHFGFLANRKKKQNLARILRAADPSRLARLRSEPSAPITAASFLLDKLGIDITRCPRCGKGELHALALSLRPP